MNKKCAFNWCSLC